MEGLNTAFNIRSWRGKRLVCALVALLFAWGACASAHAFAKGEDSVALSEGEKAYFSEIKTLRVVTLPAWQPYSYQGEGLAVDILEKLCASTGARLQAVEAESYQDAMSRLAGGEADISAVQVGGLEEGGGFVPYLRAPVQVVLHKDSRAYESAEITAALLDGVDYLDTGRYGQVKTTSFASVKDCLYAVRNRQVDFFACDLYLISPYISRLSGMDLTMESVPQHEVEMGFGLAPGADERLASALEKTVATYSTADLSSSLVLHQRKSQPESGIVNFVYQNPFELLCALACLFFVALIVLLVYTQIRVGQHQELRGYEDSYRMLADTFGQAGMEYDFLKDRLTVFGAQHDKLDLPAMVEGLHVALEQKALRISLTPESFDALLENNAPGRSYEAELQCGMKEGGMELVPHDLCGGLHLGISPPAHPADGVPGQHRSGAPGKGAASPNWAHRSPHRAFKPRGGRSANHGGAGGNGGSVPAAVYGHRPFQAF